MTFPSWFAKAACYLWPKGERVLICALMLSIFISRYERGHKVLMFSQMTRMLDIIQDYLGYRGIWDFIFASSCYAVVMVIHYVKKMIITSENNSLFSL